MKARLTVLVALLVVVVAVAAVTLAGRNTSAEQPIVDRGVPGAKSPPLEVDHRLVTANNDFGFRLLKELVSESKGKNVFISPASISLALSMTYNGASGTTKDAMAKALAINRLSIDELNKASAALLDNLNGPGPGVELSVANSLWARKGVDFKPEFMSRNREFYKAQIETLDFSSPSAVRTINSWASDKTSGRIDRIIDEDRVDDLNILFLINAVYFKGTWTHRFDRKRTENALFHLDDTSSVNVPMMRQEGRLAYRRSYTFEAVALPYGSGRIKMYVFLPSRGTTLAALIDALNAETWEEWLSGFDENKVRVFLPRWKLQCETQLPEVCKRLGMGVAFDPDKSDFRAMCACDTRNNVYISAFNQRTFIDVNEEGTEAAAATLELFRARSGCPEVRVNRPFFLAIVDNKTGSILFAGAITDPTATA